MAIIYQNQYSKKEYVKLLCTVTYNTFVCHTHELEAYAHNTKKRERINGEGIMTLFNIQTHIFT